MLRPGLAAERRVSLSLGDQQGYATTVAFDGIPAPGNSGTSLARPARTDTPDSRRSSRFFGHPGAREHCGVDWRGAAAGYTLHMDAARRCRSAACPIEPPPQCPLSSPRPSADARAIPAISTAALLRRRSASRRAPRIARRRAAPTDGPTFPAASLPKNACWSFVSSAMERRACCSRRPRRSACAR